MLETKRKYTFPVTIQLTEEDYEALRKEAYEQKTSLSALCRTIIQQYILIAVAANNLDE